MRPTMVVQKGPETSTTVTARCTAWSDSSTTYNNITPSSDLIVTWREMTHHYYLLAKITIGGPFGVDSTPTTRSAMPLPRLLFVGNNVQSGTILGNPGAGTRIVDLATVGLNRGTTGNKRFGASDTGTFQYIGGLALRTLPLQSCTNVLDFRINGQSTTTNSRSYAPIYPLLEDAGISKESMAMCPFWPTEGVIVQPFTFDDIAPMSTQVSSAPDSFFSNGTAYTSTPGDQIWYLRSCESNSTGVEFILETEVYEPLVIDPLRFGETTYEAGLVRIATFNVSMNYSNLNRTLVIGDDTYGFYATKVKNCVSQVSLVGMSSALGYACPVTNPPELIMHQSFPDPVSALRTPQFVIYDGHIPLEFTTPIDYRLAATATFLSRSYTTNQFRFAALPSKIFVYARIQPTYLDQNPALVPFLSDTFLRITRLNITVNDRIGILSQATPVDLFRMSQRNGYKGSWIDFNYKRGSLCILSMADDLCMRLNEAAGQQTPTSLQLTATVDNAPQMYQKGFADPNAVGAAFAFDGNFPLLPYELVITTITPSQVVIGASQCSFLVAGPTETQVVELMTQSASRPGNHEMPGALTGGSLSSAKSMIPTVHGDVEGGQESGGIITGGGMRR